jgi:alpha/beta superfamily hydrolase
LIAEECMSFTAAGLRLEGVLAYPGCGMPTSTWLLLVPHPHMGGRMDNNVIRHLARRGAEEGAATLRFNWRGVGDSEIDLPDGVGRFDYFAALERDRSYADLLPDALAAFDALQRSVPKAGQRVVVGYSLGSILAGMLAPRVAATHVVGVSPPTARASLAAWREVGVPKLLMAGDADFAFDREALDSEVAHMPGESRFLSLPGADHFHRQEEERVYRAIARWLVQAR